MEDKSNDWQMTNGQYRLFFQKILEGCTNVKDDKDCHEEAKKLAKLIIKDCNMAIKKAQDK